MDIAYYIKERISLPEAMGQYGLECCKGKYLCPFHAEKTPSLSLYKDNSRFRCFGCGADGTVIDLVIKLYSITYQQAIAKLAYDFSLPLPNKATHKERAEFARLDAERRRKAAAQKAAKEAEEREYWDAFDTWKRLTDIISAYRPRGFAEQLHPNFVKALRLLPLAEHQLDCLSERRLNLERYNGTPMVSG